MGYLWGLFSHKPQSQYGFYDCAPGCRASDRDVRYCTCRCQGINHGALIHGRQIRPIPVPHGNPSVFLEPEPIPQIAPQQALPNLTPSPSPSSSKAPRAPREYKLTKKIGGSFKHAMIGYSQAELNESIVKGLRTQFNEERVNAIIDQAFTIRMQHEPYANQPELYELFETGDIDRALEHFSVRWVIGRPKVRK